MKEGLILNGVVWIAGCTAISIACFVTKRATPLIGLLFLPTWSFSSKESNDPASIIDDVISNIKEMKESDK